MNHPLVRRKFLATFSLEPSGYGEGVAENVEGCRGNTRHNARSFSLSLLHSISELAFRPLSPISFSSFSSSVRVHFFFLFHTFRVIFSRVLTLLIRPLRSPFLRAMFLTAFVSFSLSSADFYSSLFLSIFVSSSSSIFFPALHFLSSSPSSFVSAQDRVGGRYRYRVDSRSPLGDNYL